MDPPLVPLAVLAISLVIGVGGIVFMFKEKVILDPESRATRIEVPIFGKLQTNTPAIAAFFIAAGLSTYTIHVWSQEPKRLPLTASVQIDGGAAAGMKELVVGVIPGSALRLQTVPGNGGSYSIEIPVADGELSYTGVARLSGPGYSHLSMGTAVPREGRLHFDAAFQPGPQREVAER